MLSIVMPTYNDELRLEWSLEALCCQTRSDFEVILVNDGGDDRAEEVALRYGGRLDLRYLYLGPPSEQFRLSCVRNLGIQHSRGDQLLFLDSDMVPDPDVVERYQEAYRPDRLIYSFRRNLGMGHLRWFKPPLDYSYLQRNASPDGRRDRWNPDQPLHSFWGCCFSAPAEICCSVGGFNEGYVGWGAEDADMAIRLARMGLKPYVFLDEAVCTHLDHPRRGMGIPDYAKERFEHTARHNVTLIGEPIVRGAAV